MIKKTYIALAFTLLISTPASAYAFFGIGSGIGGCGASAVVQGAVSQATQAVTSRAGSIIPGGGALGGLLGGAVPVDVYGQVRNDTNTLVAKECVGDPLTIALRELLIAELTRNMINWANTGFEGAPVFVTDLGRHLQATSDDVAQNFIYGNDLGGICAPFQQEVRTTIARRYSESLPQAFSERVSCTFDASLGDQGAFLKGDFSQGGWEAWWQIHSNPENNPFWVTGTVENELNRQTEEEKEIVKEEVDQGQGFLPNAGCDFLQSSTQNPYLLNIADSSTTGGSLHTINTNTRSGCHAAGGIWNIHTPGIFAANELSDILGTGRRQLEQADEIDEIINILLAQLAQKALTSFGGFAGLSSRTSGSSYGGQSYIDAIVSETSNESIDGAQNVLLINIESALALETRFRNAAELLIQSLEKADAALFTCYASIARIENASKSEVVQLYQTELTKSENTLLELERIYQQASRSITEDSLNRAAESYDALIASDTLHNSSDAEQTEDARTTLLAVEDEQATICSTPDTTN